MTTIATLAGAFVVIVALRDIFDTLFIPSGKGSLSQALARLTWRAFRGIARRYPSALQLGGPVGFLLAIASWMALLVVGWALVYWPRLPDGFSFDSGMDPSANAGFVDALYLSLATLATLGYGDITPEAGWLRIITPLQALMGFGILTAGITWLLSIFPALSHRRSLADEIGLLRAMESEAGIMFTQLDADTAQQMLAEITSQLITVRGDLTKFPASYYFHARDEQTDISAQMPYLFELSQRASRLDCSLGVRARAVKLNGAIKEFSTTISSRFLGIPSAQPKKSSEPTLATTSTLPAKRMRHLEPFRCP